MCPRECLCHLSVADAFSLPETVRPTTLAHLLPAARHEHAAVRSKELRLSPKGSRGSVVLGLLWLHDALPCPILQTDFGPSGKDPGLVRCGNEAQEGHGLVGKAVLLCLGCARRVQTPVGSKLPGQQVLKTSGLDGDGVIRTSLSKPLEVRTSYRQLPELDSGCSSLQVVTTENHKSIKGTARCVSGSPLAASIGSFDNASRDLIQS